MTEDALSAPIIYSIDHAIIMHREAHFGGNFDIMLKYYQIDGRGVCQEFDINRLLQLQQLEQYEGVNLSHMLLSPGDIEKIATIKNMYQKLRDLYKVQHPKSPIPTLIADLILAENEDIKATIEAVVEQKKLIVRALIDVLREENLYDPLYPGYGQAPMLAAESLGCIGDYRALISLFEHIGENDFDGEETILRALRLIGQPAKEFLIRAIQSLPLTVDNEKAAVALIAFKGDELVVKACLKMLFTLNLKTHEILATYLVLACEGVTSLCLKEELIKFSELKTTPKLLRLDIHSIL